MDGQSIDWSPLLPPPMSLLLLVWFDKRARGSIQKNFSTANWFTFDLSVETLKTKRKPTKILITAAAATPINRKPKKTKKLCENGMTAE